MVIVNDDTTTSSCHMNSGHTGAKTQAKRIMIAMPAILGTTASNPAFKLVVAV